MLPPSLWSNRASRSSVRADKPTRQLSWDSHCQSFKTSLELDSDICDWFSAEAANKSVHLIVAKKKKNSEIGCKWTKYRSQNSKQKYAPNCPRSCIYSFTKVSFTLSTMKRFPSLVKWQIQNLRVSLSGFTFITKMWGKGVLPNPKMLSFAVLLTLGDFCLQSKWVLESRHRYRLFPLKVRSLKNSLSESRPTVRLFMSLLKFIKQQNSISLN